MPDRNSNIFSQKNINITDFILESVKRWYVTSVAIIIALIVSIIYTLGFVTPMYTSTAKIFILSKQSDEYYTSADFSISTYLSNDFAEIIVDTPVLEPTSKDLNNKYSVNYLKRVVTVSKPENTRIIEISAKSPSAEDSKAIVDSVCENSKEKLVELMKLDSVEIITQGNIPSRPSSPNLFNNLIFAFIIAFLIAETAIAINFVFNNKISSPSDIEKYLELNVLATIPYNQSKTKVK